jgi:lysophospholipase L1-like esterase
LRLGTRWTITQNNARIPTHSYEVDDVELTDAVPPSAAHRKPRPLREVTGLLREHKPVKIICMGDSITAGTALKNPDAERYATVLQAKLREAFGYPEITCESRAVGGARVSDARSWVSRDFEGEAPDLVTMLYGYNDKSGQWTTAAFALGLDDYVHRVTDATGGKAAIVPISTIPGAGPRYTMMDDFAQIVRDVSAKNGLECCDMPERLKREGREGWTKYLADMAHPNADGHVLMAQILTDWLVAKAKEQ